MMNELVYSYKFANFHICLMLNRHLTSLYTKFDGERVSIADYKRAIIDVICIVTHNKKPVLTDIDKCSAHWHQFVPNWLKAMIDRMAQSRKSAIIY